MLTAQIGHAKSTELKPHLEEGRWHNLIPAPPAPHTVHRPESPCRPKGLSLPKSIHNGCLVHLTTTKDLYPVVAVTPAHSATEAQKSQPVPFSRTSTWVSNPYFIAVTDVNERPHQYKKHRSVTLAEHRTRTSGRAALQTRVGPPNDDAGRRLQYSSVWPKRCTCRDRVPPLPPPSHSDLRAPSPMESPKIRASDHQDVPLELQSPRRKRGL